MNTRQHFCRWICGILCAMCVLCAIPGISLAAEQTPTVRVGFFAFDGYHMQDSEGNRSGYGYELLQHIAGYAGFRYEYVGYDKSWSEIQEMLANGEIDLVTSAQKTDARLERFDFSQNNVGVSAAILTAKAGDYKYQPEDHAHWSGMRIGLLKDNSRNAGLEEYARLHGFTYEPVYFDDTDAMIQALQQDDSIDAILTSNLRRFSGENVLAQFDTSPFYVMVNKGNTELLSKIDAAIVQMDHYEPGFRTKLMNEYYPTAAESTIFFTADERAYIQEMQNKTFTAIINPDRTPYSFLKDGKLEGSLYEGALEIIARSGLHIEFLQPKDRTEYWQLLQDGAVEICFDVDANYNRAEHIDYWLTSSYISVPIARLYHEDTTTFPTAALLRNSSIAQTYADSAILKGVQVTYYDSMAELTDAILNKQRSMAFLPQNSAAVAVREDQTNRLVSEPVYGYSTQYAIAVRMDQSPFLYSILRKSVSSLKDADMAIFNRSYEGALEKPFSVVGYVYDHPLSIVMFGLALLLVLILVISLISASRRKKVAQLAIQQDLNNKLQRHHDFLQHLYNTLPCAVFRYSYEPPHRILSYNAACARLYGYTEEAPFVGQTPDAVVSAGSEADFQQKFSLCEQTEGPIRYVWSITRKDGAQAYVECVMDIVDTDDGKVFQEICVDVTERVRNEMLIQKRYTQELHRSEKQDLGLRYTAVFDVTEQVLKETTIDSPAIHAGMSVREFAEGLLPELQDLQTQAELDDFVTRFTAERLQSAYDNGQYEQSFLLRRRKDGDLDWLRSDLTLRYNPADGHLMCFDYIYDVTDEQVTGEIMRRMALTNCMAFVCIDAMTGHCLEYTVGEDFSLRRSHTVYGQSGILRKIADAMTQNARDELLAATQAAAVLEQLGVLPRHQVFATYTNEAGERRDASLTYFFMDQKNELLAMTVSDVTQVRASEVQHAALLANALAAAEKADAAKSQFLSRVSHEMRTPLNAIIGFIELARDAPPEKMATCLASSDLAAKQLLNVINDVLDMSSIESGKLKIANASFNFRHVITSITNIYGTQCKQKGITFDARITNPMDDWLVGDELRVNQILMNLLGNAVKFTSQGFIRLTVTQMQTEDTRVFLRFSVADSGCGMSDAMKQRLFKPFEQENATTARKFGGNGLGLSIVKSLVGMMGGTISVQSKEGEGTTFTVDLPFERSDVVQQSTLPQTLNALRVLVVDDEANEREYMTLVLNRMGVRFTCVDGGNEALAALRASQEQNDIFNVCLVDWRMPGMNGFDTSSRIRAAYGKDVVVIVVSAYDFQQTDESVKQAGANLFLSKPIFQSALFDLFMTLTHGNIAKPKEEPQSWDFAGRRVLLVEDNELNQIVAKGYLARFNVVIDLAENGQSAVEMFTASAPGYYDAILMDVQMPVMDGLEATRAIRASSHPQAASIQIIAQTADAFSEDITRILSAGMNAHVSKPIRPDTLAKALHRAFTAV